MPRQVSRPVRLQWYAILLLFFGFVLFLTHIPYLRLPYFWDEAGQFVPAALDILHSGALVPVSAIPNIHSPAVPAYLAAFWRLTTVAPVATRSAMLLLATFALLIVFLLAIELCKHVPGMPAFVAVALVAASPLFFAQAMLAQLDAPAMLFTLLALLCFVQDRIPAAVAASVLLVLVKETGLVVPLVFALILLSEHRRREAAWFLLPAAALAGWIAWLYHTTGHWAGSAGFARYNLYYPLHPLRIALAFGRRVYYLFLADFRWIGTAAVVYAAFRPGRGRLAGMFRSRSWRVAAAVVGAHLVMLSLVGGAVLARYLLPVMAIVFIAMTASLWFLPRWPRLVLSAALLAGTIGANFLNPPYPFPYEDNLAFTDFLKLHAATADYLARWHSSGAVTTAWPLTMELAHPDLGFVAHPLAVHAVPNLSAATLAATDWSRVQVAVVFSYSWDPAFNLMHYRPIVRFWRHAYEYVPDVTREQARRLIPFPREAHMERHGQWVDIYVNPRAGRTGWSIGGGSRPADAGNLANAGAAQVLEK
jgi:4-amino-4-deoxy-L-arabinose transferase-like glycosyltransferase